ncbi:DNA replication complex GINS protein SLD5 [Pelomyxa schiedti]|nr:DNA replication complex GINS protein SLD5 [Pelomyxa schiedti]
MASQSQSQEDSSAEFESPESQRRREQERQRSRAPSAYDAMRRACFNEVFAPEVLPYKVDVVLPLIEKIGQLEDLCKNVNDQRLSSVYELDIERAKYLLLLYHKTRLLKIEKFFLHYSVHNENLSPEEVAFTTRFCTLVDTHLNKSFLQHIGPNADQLSNLVKPPTPNLNHHVFIHVCKSLSAHIDVGGKDILLIQGDIHVVPYHCIAHLLSTEEVELI